LSRALPENRDQITLLFDCGANVGEETDLSFVSQILQQEASCQTVHNKVFKFDTLLPAIALLTYIMYKASFSKSSVQQNMHYLVVHARTAFTRLNSRTRDLLHVQALLFSLSGSSMRINVNICILIIFGNSDLHRDLGIKTITDIFTKFAKSHEKRLQDHINIEASRHLNLNNITRRLKRKKPFELVIR
jgi:hypothetical protein